MQRETHTCCDAPHVPLSQMRLPARVHRRCCCCCMNQRRKKILRRSEREEGAQSSCESLVRKSIERAGDEDELMSFVMCRACGAFAKIDINAQMIRFRMYTGWKKWAGVRCSCCQGVDKKKAIIAKRAVITRYIARCRTVDFSYIRWDFFLSRLLRTVANARAEFLDDDQKVGVEIDSNRAAIHT